MRFYNDLTLPINQPPYGPYKSPNVPQKIGTRSGQEADSTLTVNDSYPIYDLSLSINATLAANNHVVFILVAPDGTSVQVPTGTNIEVTGFNYHNTKGTWTLRMYNAATAAKPSTLNSWSFTVLGPSTQVPPPPSISSFKASPNPTAGNPLTLTVGSITNSVPGSTITQVAIYMDSNHDGVLDLGTDSLLGYAVYQPSLGVWTLTDSGAFGLTAGTYKLFAQAEDNYGNLGDPVALTLTVR